MAEKKLLQVQSVGTRYFKFVVNSKPPGPVPSQYDVVGKLDIQTGEYSPKNLLILAESYQVIGPAAHHLAQAKTPVDSVYFPFE